MKKRLLKTLTSLVLVVLMVATMIPALSLGISAEENTVTMSFGGGTGKNQDPITIKDTSGISAEFVKGTHTSSSPYWATDHVRFYGTDAMSNTFTILAPKGTTITKIVFTCTKDSYSMNNAVSDSGKVDDNVWTGSANKIVFTTTKQARIKSAEITYITEDTNCDHTNTTAIGEAKNATCTEDGITAGEKCADCDKTITAQEIIPATGHNYVDGVCTVCQANEPEAKKYVKVDLSDITASMKVIIIATNSDGKSHAMSNNNGTDRAPEAISVTVSNGEIYIVDDTDVVWNIANENGNLTIYPAGQTETWLYCTDNNNGVRVGTNTDKVFTLDATTGYLKHTAQSRYLGVYNNADWRCYTSTTSNTKGQTFSFYKEYCAHANTVAIGEAKNATCTEDGITAGKTCTACGETLEAQETIPATGHTDENKDKICDVCETPLCGDDHTWVDNDEVITAPTCTATGLIGQHCSVCGEPNPEDRVMDKTDHTPETDKAVDPTCTKTGLTEGSHCSVCKEVLTAQNEVPMVDHSYVDGKCRVCHDIIVTGSQLADFQFGENGEANHKDGNTLSAGDVETAGSYTLTFDSATSVYNSAFDAKGNSALKLGTSKASASFKFTVPNNVNTVVFYIAGYKTNNAKIQVNSKEYTVASHSDDGDYTKIVVDTTTDKTVTLETVSGGYRAMIDSIKFYGEEVAAEVPAQPTIDRFGISLNKGITIKVEATVPSEWVADNADAKFVFKSGENVLQTCTITEGTSTYALDLTPGQIGNDITFVLVLGDTEEVASKNVSFATYKDMAEAAAEAGKLGLSDTKYSALVTLLGEIEDYAAAVNGKGEETLGDDAFNDVDNIDKVDDAGIFTGFTASIGECASLKISINPELLENNAYTVIVTLNGKELLNDDLTGSININGLYPVHFNDTIAIDISDVEMAEFSFNSCLKALYEYDGSNDAVKQLAIATYNYGVAVEAYNTAE